MKGRAWGQIRRPLAPWEARDSLRPMLPRARIAAALLTLFATGCSLEGLADGSGAGSSGVNSSGSQGGANDLAREAEDGVLTGNFVIVEDEGASAGKYVVVPEDKNCEFDAVRFALSVQNAGKYRIKTRVATGPEEGTDNSFVVTVDGTPAGPAFYDLNISSTFVDDYVRDGDVPEPVVFDLAAGPHEIVFGCREDGTRLDRIELEIAP